MLDLDFVRAQFPALDTPWALFDNAGGSVPARQAIGRVSDYMSRLQVQHGASYSLSAEASATVAAGRRAAARLVNAAQGEVIFGASSSVLVTLLAHALLPQWQAGDEIIVTDLDHEANIGPWRKLEAAGLVLREWRMNPETAALEMEGLEEVLSEGTRLVAFTHCANVVGQIHDVRRFAARIRSAGALSCVDGVAYAPHRRVDVQALGVDFYFLSLYKVFGPHIGMLYGRRELLERASGQSHFFIAEDNLPGKLEPGNPSHELAAGVAGVVDYLAELERHHARLERGNGNAPPALENAEDAEVSNDLISQSFARIARQEACLVEPLLSFLAEHPRTTLIGTPASDEELRVPTVTFTVAGMRSDAMIAKLDEARIAARFGHFYAYRAIERWGLLEQEGVVRASLLHYNTPDEVQRLITALEAALS